MPTSDTSSVIGSTKASSVAIDSTVIDESITEFSGEEHPQPSVVSQRLPDKSVVRTSDVRVSNRVNKSSITLKRYPTVYNDLTGEIDPHTVKWLDRNLFIGEEIKEVYGEIIRTTSSDHLLFDGDAFVEKTASQADISMCTASSSLNKGRGERIMNVCLHREVPPPWEGDTADNWRNSPKFGGLGREDILQAKIGKGAEGGTGSKSYNSWLAWWRSTVTSDDYLKYLSTQENDYLSVIFHLYDSEEDSDEEDGENENRPDTIQMALLKEREKKLTELKTQKTDFQPGFWNANSILLGGLGKDPIIEDDELLANIEGPFLSAGDTVTQGRSSSVSVTSKKSDSLSDKKSVRSRDSFHSDRQLNKKTAIARSNTSTSVADKSEASSMPSISAQDRLERLWTLLCMPDAQRLDMAIKYSAEPYCNKLEEALASWEAAAEVVLERESVMTQLEDFERMASDPNRFFDRGAGGTALSRIRESKTRESFDKRLVDLDKDVRKAVAAVKKRFEDVVTFQGRPYQDKIQTDRTEMLYWLHQERRQNAFDAEVIKSREITLRVPELPTIPTETLL
ncbi:predicted protein [Nematostella vectensis]|uniref:Uncharacterized protein n=2 Tax=Nematostella vectensis TaxID=45351 RepID=A7RR76_NEMVE|nr:predicted protein [Nematostella vectensis]|eukprot:XP_001638180.1 predicted protein [Nematostella vectensis]